jgi:type I restriction enzyme S subunit
MSEWKEFKLMDVCIQIIDCINRTAPVVNYKTPFSMIRTSDVKNGKIDFSGLRNVTEETYSIWTRRGKLQIGDVILTREAPIGDIAIIKGNEKLFLGQRTMMYRANTNLLDYNFLYYSMLSPYLQEQIKSSAMGSVVEHIRVPDAKDFIIRLPEIQEQKAIASVLSSLDNKIDLLHRQNQSLEAMAETLFRQWFIEEAEESWEKGKLGDYVKTNAKSINKEYKHEFIEYLDTSSLNKGMIDSTQYLALIDAPSRSRRLVQYNDIVFSTVRPDQRHYGLIKNHPNNLVVSTGFCVITCVDIDPHFVYLLLTNDTMTEFLHSIAEGSTSTYPSLRPEDLENIEFQLPPLEKMNQFSDLASDFWSKISKNHTQIRTLTQLRDTLLPKLMSGEVRVSEK